MDGDGFGRASSEGNPPRSAGRVGCLLLHGLGGGPYELNPLIDALIDEGLHTEAPLLPGHDGPGPRMPPSRWSDWVDTAETAFAGLAASGDPVAVIGFSTGAVLALHLAATSPVACQALLAPFLAIRYSGYIPCRPASLLRPLARIIPDLPRRPPAVRDPEMRKWAARASRFRTFNLCAALSALELIDRVKPLASSITTPTLIVQGRLDTVVEPEGAGWLHENLGAAEKTLISLPRSDHLVALDRDRDQAIRETVAFVRARRGPDSRDQTSASS